MRLPCVAIAVVIALQLLLANSLAQETKTESAEELVVHGRYNLVPKGKADDPRGQALWAFARLQLTPNVEVHAQAKKAHEQGDPLGSFVLLLCHREGIGVLRDQTVMQKINFELRTVLEKIEKPTALEQYMLSRCHAGDEKGISRNADAEKLFEEKRNFQKRQWERLQASAKGGIAQAAHDIAKAYQSNDDHKAALEWFQKAADAGLAAGKRYAGLYFILGGPGIEKDAERGIMLTGQAADEGDVYAMINMAMFSFQGTGVKQDLGAAQKWLDQAAQSGHWMGAMEKGTALLAGEYGYKKDETKGRKYLQQAVDTGAGEALFFVANAYRQGFGVEQNGKNAVKFAQAAFRQGQRQGAALLSDIYSNGVGDVKADEELAKFWGSHAQTPEIAAKIAGDPFALEGMKGLDPFKLKVE